MDALRATFEAELANYADTPMQLRCIRAVYRGMLIDDPDLQSDETNPMYIFLRVINNTERIKQIDTDDAMKGGAAKHAQDLFNRMTIPEEFSMVAADIRSSLQRRINCRKGEEMYKLIQAGWSKEAIQAKKDEVGWGQSEQFYLEHFIKEAHDRQRDMAQ